MIVPSRELRRLPREPGAYVLVIDLTRELALDLKARGDVVLAPGRYAYCGSAYGPGGLRARIGRHLRPDKAVRWHVDQLTAAGQVTALAAVPGGRECALLRGVLAVEGAGVPVPGFGSSDCRNCPAHLASVPAEFDLGANPGLTEPPEAVRQTR